MPGIFGIVNHHGGDIKIDMIKMAKRMGSDGLPVTNIWYDQNKGLGLGHTGLDVFIREEQPVSSNSGIKVVLSGEVVNEAQIRSDLLQKGLNAAGMGKASLVLQQYLQYGVDGISEINGSLAIAIWDEPNQRLTLVPDRFGQRSIYYAEANGIFAFASEIKALLALDFVPKSVNPEAVMEYLAIEQLNHDRTFLKWIKRIPYQSVLTYQNKNIFVEDRWPTLYQQPEKESSEMEYVEEFIRLSRQAVRERIKNPKTCIGLSGGLDSRFLTALVIQEELRIDTVTYGQKGSRDLVRGKKVSEESGLPHTSLILKDNYLLQYAQPMIDRVDGLFNVLGCHGMILTQLAERYPVIVMANGLDQLVWSNRSKHSEYQNFSSLPEAVFKTQNEFIYQKDWKKWYSTKWNERFSASVYNHFLADFQRAQADTVDNCIDSYMMQTYACYFGSSLPMISHKMEYSEPFYDLELIKFILRLPLSMRWNRKLLKSALIYLSPSLARVDGGPLAVSTRWKRIKRNAVGLSLRAQRKIGLIPPARSKRPSSTFSDLHQLLRTKRYRAWLNKNLLKDNVIVGDIFQPDVLKLIVNQHISGEINRTKELGVILTVELYLKSILGSQSHISVMNESGLNIPSLSMGKQKFVS